MSKINLPDSSREVTKIILKGLPSRRMRDVLEKRFGLKGGRKYTLEAIGREYKITRERVRQIESDALKHLAKKESIAEAEPILASVREHIGNHGGIMAEHHLISTVGDGKNHPYLNLLLGVSENFHEIPEKEKYHKCWATDETAANRAEKIISGVINNLSEKNKAVTQNELHSLIGHKVEEETGKTAGTNVLENYLAMSKVIKTNPYGEYGIKTWPVISPAGIKDKAYAALAKAGSALHFLDITDAINKANWSKKKAHPQTVHNELIKDDRFVLVGRGLYALKEWGYEPGVVREVLASVLKKAGEPLPKEDLIKSVLEKRFVKVPTIILNLQNKNMFKRTGDGKYFLV